MAKKRKATHGPAGGDNMSVSADIYKTIVSIVDERVEGIKVARSNFDSLTKDIKDLTQAQKETDATVKRLAAAQEKTNATVERLAAAQEKTEERVDSLNATVKELALAQKRSESKFEAMVEVMHQTRLEITDMNRRIGGISNSIGYSLENEVYRHLPKLLGARYRLKIEEKLLRKQVKYADGSKGEINIYATGKMNGKAVAVIGEVKTRLAKQDIDDLKEKSVKLRRTIRRKIFLVFATHFCAPEVIRYAKKNGIAVVMTYEFI